MKTLILIAALLVLAAAQVAKAGGVTVTATPNPVAVGGAYTIEICGAGGRTVDYRVTQPDSSLREGQAYGHDCVNIQSQAPLGGEYLIEVFNKNGSHLLASTTLTAI